MDNVVAFDPSRPRLPRSLERFQPSPHTEFLPVWIDGEITLHNILRGLQSVGLTIKTDGRRQGFIIAKDD